ncbi:MAG TPA: IclR family transcriptional regulator C-terminal domain-containing protein, partial [Pseudonocardia sp.]|nr:IclR family transcriptional regulator C-terminal domain-containing protein [Pseudonocardia sp.]
TITSVTRLRRALAVARLTRVAVSRFELEADTCGVGVPVFGPGGHVVAAVELSVPDLGAALHSVLAGLTLAARSLSRELAGLTEPEPALVDEPIRPAEPAAIAAGS